MRHLSSGHGAENRLVQLQPAAVLERAHRAPCWAGVLRAGASPGAAERVRLPRESGRADRTHYEPGERLRQRIIRRAPSRGPEEPAGLPVRRGCGAAEELRKLSNLSYQTQDGSRVASWQSPGRKERPRRGGSASRPGARRRRQRVAPYESPRDGRPRRPPDEERRDPPPGGAAPERPRRAGRGKRLLLGARLPPDARAQSSGSRPPGAGKRPRGGDPRHGAARQRCAASLQRAGRARHGASPRPAGRPRHGASPRPAGSPRHEQPTKRKPTTRRKAPARKRGSAAKKPAGPRMPKAPAAAAGRRGGFSLRRLAARFTPPVKPPVEAYSGAKPYLFASYSHKNMREVFTVIKKLSDSRFRDLVRRRDRAGQ